ncbi:hypothetical protein A1D31_40235 [Bradyrhizobium liaoningense]|nr:hypothetical protein A1D31_40235 [Bradyrhizobium liaoningense]
MTAVIARVRKYEHDIQAKETQESLIEGYVGVCRNMVEISSQSPARPIDDLVRQVAEGTVGLSIHPHVFLLIYDFGKDEKKGRIKEKRQQLEEARDKDHRQGQGRGLPVGRWRFRRLPPLRTSSYAYLSAFGFSQESGFPKPYIIPDGPLLQTQRHFDQPTLIGAS